MKNPIILVLTVAVALVVALPSTEIKPRNLIVPAGRPEGRITRGRSAIENQFPYQVFLRLKDSITNTYKRCGGSLLSHKLVLTAAHCTLDVSEVQVFLGTTNLKAPFLKYIVRDMNDIIIHEDYNNNGKIVHDISVIRIPFTEYNEKIQPVKLPEISDNNYNYEGVIATGWGRTNNSFGNMPDILQWAHLVVISNDLCKLAFEPKMPIEAGQICTATLHGVNTCNGHSGGPLVLASTNVQIGLTSFGDPDCLISFPGVYTRVTYYLDWIRRYL